MKVSNTMSKSTKTSKSSRTVRRASTSIVSSANVDRSIVQEIQTRILTLVDRKSTWEGTMSDLQIALTTGIRRAAPANFPKSPSFLRRVVNATVPTLRRNGIRVEFSRTTDHARTRLVSFVQS
jgi:hypothetical protein